MVKCPNCGKLGAIVTDRLKGLTTFYCNLCGKETSLPTWWGITFECDKKEGINRPTFGTAKNFGKDATSAMDYIHLTYECPRCGSSRVAQDAVCAQKDAPLMLGFSCCDCRHKFERLYEPPKAVTNFKEATTMQVTYNGFTGELVKLQQEDLHAFGLKDRIYNLSIYDSEYRVTHSFTGVKLEDVKFLGGAVAFGG